MNGSSLPPPPSQPPAAPGPPGPPEAPAAERVRIAWQRRPDTDYIFSFWTAFGWTILTLGIYFYYVVYRLTERSRDHNRRRVEMLDGATTFAWQQAEARGLADELRPNFERIATHQTTLRNLDTQFREPAVWTLLCIVTGIAAIVLWVLIDRDLVAHDRAEGAIEAELSEIYGRLGAPITPPDPGRLKGPHNWVGRVIATIVTLGIYGLWWLYNIMNDTNDHYHHNWPWEDELAAAVQSLQR